MAARAPPRTICGCRSHSEPSRSAVGRCGLTSPSVGLGASHTTRALGQAKEPRARPMRSGNPLGDHAQRAITLALIFEPVLANEHIVGASAPLTHQSCSGLRHESGVKRTAASLELAGEGL